MTQVMTVAPRIVGELASVEEPEKLLNLLIDGDIGANIKMQLIEPYSTILDSLHADLEQARLESISAYASLQLAIRNIMNDGEIFNTLETLYSPIVASNFRFALQSLMTLLQILSMSVQQIPTEEYDFTDLDIDKIKSEFSDFVSKSKDIQDATVLIDQDESSILSELVLALNMGMFMVLVFLVATIAKKKESISVPQIDQIEILLRDWTQEVMAQLATISNNASKGKSSFELTGIIPDKDDFEILEDRNLPLSDNSE